jgi:hypothetical protein
MKVVALEDTQMTLAELAALVQTEPVILTRNGKPLATIKDVSGCDWESVALANNPQFLALIEESRRSYQESGGITLDAARKELGLAEKPGRRRSPGSRRRAKRPAGGRRPAS